LEKNLKNLYYATKIDKSGNKLTASYLTEKNREKYNKGASFEDTVLYADISEEGRLAIVEKNSQEGFILRGILVNNSPYELDGHGGDFVLYARTNGKWVRTPFTFPTYSAANTAMKSMIPQFEALLIRDESGAGVADADNIYEPTQQNLSIGE
jgi:hypothetical protein